MSSKETFLSYLEIYEKNYGGHKKKINNNNICIEITKLINLMPLNHDGIDEFCKCISTNCIIHNIIWKNECFNLIINTLLNCIENIKIKKEKNKILCCLRTIGHLVFERGNKLNDINKKKLIKILINFISPNLNIKLFNNNNKLINDIFINNNNNNPVPKKFRDIYI